MHLSEDTPYSAVDCSLMLLPLFVIRGEWTRETLMDVDFSGLSDREIAESLLGQFGNKLYYYAHQAAFAFRKLRSAV